MNRNPIIAAATGHDALLAALSARVETIFFLQADIASLTDAAEKSHHAGKKLFLHIDLAEGLGKDRAGILYAAKMGVDGIISTRSGLIRAARECGLITVQRFFIVDTHSIDTTVASLAASKADYIEVMPGIAPKIIEKLRARIETPIIAGGLIETPKEAAAAIKSGAFAVSTGSRALWNLGKEA